MLYRQATEMLADLRSAFQQWRRGGGSLMAAGVSYYAALSFFPLLLVLISGLGFFMRFSGLGQDSRRRLLDWIAEQSSAQLAGQVSLILAEVETKAAFNGPLGLLTLLVTAVAIFTNFEYAFDRIWSVAPEPTAGLWTTLRRVLVYRLRAFLMLFGVGLLVLATFLSGMVLSTLAAWTPDFAAAAEFWGALQIGVSLLLNAVSAALIYKILPKVDVGWRAALQGGLLAAVVWLAGRQLLVFFLIGGRYNAYGVVGSFIAILLWIFYMISVLLIAAQYVQVIRQRRGVS